ncbi:MAG: class I SAM-dependent methyltransferase [Muribaculaceae bacterium]|nr:class I SAM-dependent methyltransferase [Muribaculaceae bacterium]
METKVLEDNQLEHFNTDLMLPCYWEVFLSVLERNIDSNKSFSVLDVGGGIGLFADKLISMYPNAEVTILDNSEYLLSQNKQHARKHFIHGSAMDLELLLADKSYDIISFNWVLHHLVSGSRATSMDNISMVLKEAARHLKDNGYISIIENLYNGIIIDSYPTKLIYNLTSISFKPVSSLIRKVGFNTAGVGVNFMSEKIISKLIIGAGLSINSSDALDCWYYNLFVRLVLMTKPMKILNIWCQRV